jgi:spermidine synthase
VGVEQNRDVLEAARRWLDLDALGVEVVEADAREYLARARRRFDLVVEDIFVGRGRAVYKPSWLSSPGLELARQRLAPRGLLVCNTIDESSTMLRVLRRLFPATVGIEVEDYDNRVLVAGPKKLEARALRRAVRADPILRATLPRLSFRTLR